MNKNHTNLMFTLSIFISLFSFATLIFFFKIIENKNEHTSKLLSTLEDKIIKKENVSTLAKKIAEIQETNNTLSSYFVNPKEIDSFIEYLENLGNSTGTLVKVEGFDTTISNNTLVVRLSVKGTFTNVMRIIMMLENAPYQIHITKTYLNQETQSTITNDDGTTKPTQVKIWQADILFSVLLSS